MRGLAMHCIGLYCEHLGRPSQPVTSEESEQGSELFQLGPDLSTGVAVGLCQALCCGQLGIGFAAFRFCVLPLTSQALAGIRAVALSNTERRSWEWWTYQNSSFSSFLGIARYS